MMLEDRLRRELQAEDAAIPKRSGSLDSVLRRGRHLRRTAWVATAALATLAAVGAVVVIGFSLPRVPTAEVTALDDAGSGGIVELVGVAFSYSSELSDDPLVFAGVLGPEPRFDTSTLGHEVPLVQGFTAESLRDLPGPEPTGPILYAGSIDSTPIVVYQGAMGPLEEFFDLVEDGHHDGTLCWAALQAGCSRPAERGIIGWGQRSAEGIVDEDVAVVSVIVNDIPVVWQRPVSGVFSVPFDGRESIQVALYTADGTEVVTRSTLGLP